MRGIIAGLCGVASCFAVASGAAIPIAVPAVVIAKLSDLPVPGAIFQDENSAEQEWYTLTEQFVAAYSDGNIEAAERAIRRALALAQTAFGPSHPYTADSFNKLGLVYESREDFERAKKHYQAAVD